MLVSYLLRLVGGARSLRYQMKYSSYFLVLFGGPLTLSLAGCVGALDGDFTIEDEASSEVTEENKQGDDALNPPEAPSANQETPSANQETPPSIATPRPPVPDNAPSVGGGMVEDSPAAPTPSMTEPPSPLPDVPSPSPDVPSPTVVPPPVVDLPGYFFDEGREQFRVLWTQPAGLLSSAQEITWVNNEGSPELGALFLEVPFNDVNQKVEIAIGNLPNLDMSGKVLSAQVKLGSGLNTDSGNPGGAKLYVKSAQGFVFADGGWVNLAAGDWTKISLIADTPSFAAGDTYDPTQIVEIGVEVATGGAGIFQQATILIDSITWE